MTTEKAISEERAERTKRRQKLEALIDEVEDALFDPGLSIEERRLLQRSMEDALNLYRNQTIGPARLRKVGGPYTVE